MDSQVLLELSDTKYISRSSRDHIIGHLKRLDLQNLPHELFYSSQERQLIAQLTQSLNPIEYTERQKIFQDFKNKMWDIPGVFGGDFNDQTQTVTLFGTEPRPKDLPEIIEYQQTEKEIIHED